MHMGIPRARQWSRDQRILSPSESERGKEMRSQARRRFIICVLLAFVVPSFATQGAFAAEGSPNESSIVLFSQGRAVVDPQNRDGSRQEAVRDFLVQAVIQAASRILTPSELETRYSSLSESVFTHPERYVLSYKISSEVVEEGNLYRIAGQVSIAMDLLKNDVPRHGPTHPGSPSAVAPDALDAPPGVTPALKDRAGDSPSREATGVKAGLKRVFWAVAERWGEGWHVPRSGVDPEGTFTGFVSQEVEDFGWSMLFPSPDFPQPDDNGSLAPEAVLVAARQKGATHAVFGRLGFYEDPSGATRLSTTLSVLDVASGNRGGGFERELPIDEAAAEEKAMELAALAVPQLDRMLGQFTSGEGSHRGGESKVVEPADLPKGDGLILRLRSKRPQADWEEIEGIIRRKAGSIQILGLRFGKEGGLVQLQGVEKGALLSLDGFRLEGGATLRIEDPSPDGNSIALTIIHPEPSQTNQ